MLAQDTLGNVLALTYFGRASYTAKKQLPVGETRWVAGKLERFGDMLQIVHPDHVVEEGGDTLQRLCEPVYRLSEGLTQPRLAGLIAQALGKAPELPEWIEESQRDKADWPAWRDALVLAHKGEHGVARDRLADELLANSLALMLVAGQSQAQGPALRGTAAIGASSTCCPLTGAQTHRSRK